MSFGFKADPSGLYGTVTIDGVDSLVINKDGSIVGNNFADSNGQLLSAGATNHIIDGDFNFWYEGTSQTTSGYGSDTMWYNGHTGSTKINSRQSFSVGQTEVPGNPIFFSRTAVTSVVGASNGVTKSQRTEGVESFSGKTATLSFWAKADSSKDIAIEFAQYFGSGGSPSATVDEIGIQKVTLGTSWAKYTVQVVVPSISGKVIGTNATDFFRAIFWFDAGSDSDTNTDSLGQQSGTFDIARVRLVEGEVDGDSIKEEITATSIRICRYYESGEVKQWGYVGSSFYSAAAWWKTRMRALPACAFTHSGLINLTYNTFNRNVDRLAVVYTPTTSNANCYADYTYTADARL